MQGGAIPNPSWLAAFRLFPYTLMHLFVTGTTTEVGKTEFTCALVRSWLREGKRAVALKPLATGGQEDVRRLWEAQGGRIKPEEITPVFWELPAAPLVILRREGRELPFSFLCRHVQDFCLQYPYVAVEGLGGWLSPLAPGRTVREWVKALGLPVVLVSKGELGTLSPTLATVESIRASGVPLLGIALNFYGVRPGPATETNAEILEEWTSLPVFSFGGSRGFPEKLPPWLS